MPSRRRKKPSSPRARRVITTPMPRWVTEAQMAESARSEFIARAEQWGYRFDSDQVSYIGTGSPGECWSNAWAYAQTHGLGYAEGVAAMPDGWHAHAWCVDAGGRVVEPTKNYDHATEYRGWVLNAEGEAAVEALLDGTPRTSFLEAGIGSGVAAWEKIVERFCASPAAQ